jgi:hypothetical protein
MIRITGRFRLLVRLDPRRENPAQRLGDMAWMMLLTGVPVAGVGAVAGLGWRVLAFSTLACAVLALSIADMLISQGRSAVLIDPGRGIVRSFRRGLIRWRRDARLSDFCAIDVVRRGEDGDLLELRFVRPDGWLPMRIGSRILEDEIPPVLARLASATGLRLTPAAWAAQNPSAG